jgi:hypothetical protein
MREIPIVKGWAHLQYTYVRSDVVTGMSSRFISVET